jgi:hypothetical protein
MKTTIRIVSFILAMFFTNVGFAQSASSNSTKTSKVSTTMKTYVIEREIPGAGNLSGAELKTISQTSCSVIKDLGPGIEWIQSYVTENKIYCIYRAESEEVLRIHATKGGFPINKVSVLSTMISPATATAELPEAEVVKR